MKIDIVTLFPEICAVPLGESIMGRAQKSGLLELAVHDLREFGQGKHRRVDDIPYGGGQGMVMKPEPVFEAVEKVRGDDGRVVLMTPQGRRFDQKMAEGYAGEAHLVVLSAHYEGIDHRVVDGLVDDEVSIGDYVLTNGAIAATVFIDAVVRLIPGVLGDENSAEQESFQGGRHLEAPQYTRPPEFRGMKVPDVLLSGHHAEIEAWREAMSRKRTEENRPDLLG